MCIQNHPAGDVTGVSVVPVKMTMKIGYFEIYRNITYIDTVVLKGCKEEKNKTKVAGMAFCVFVLFIAVKIDSKLTLHNMGKVLLFNLPSLKSGGLYFLKQVFLTTEKL